MLPLWSSDTVFAKPTKNATLPNNLKARALDSTANLPPVDPLPLNVFEYHPYPGARQLPKASLLNSPAPEINPIPVSGAFPPENDEPASGPLKRLPSLKAIPQRASLIAP